MAACALITAAGRSTRMGLTVKKEYLPMGTGHPEGATVLSSCALAFLATRLFSTLLITVPQNGSAEADRALRGDSRVRALLEELHIEPLYTEGGATRQDSVRQGLEFLNRLQSRTDIVLVHDGARPFVTPQLIESVYRTTLARQAAVPVIPVVDTCKVLSEDGRILEHLNRETLGAVQTPQGFFFEDLLEAHRRADIENLLCTDDTEIWARYAGEVYTCPGEMTNRKITYQGDLS